MHVIVRERLHDVEFVLPNATHFDKLRDFVENTLRKRLRRSPA